MLFDPLDEREPARVMTPGHFENFVGVRLNFTGDVDDAMASPASDLADLVNSDVDGDTAGPLGDLVGGVDDLDRDSDLGDIADATAAANELELDLIDQSTTPPPDPGPGVVPQESGTGDGPPVITEIPLPPPDNAFPEEPPQNREAP